MVIERRNLRSQVREELLGRMRAGQVRPGESINEQQLADELGVSRTPLREALIALESEGQITSSNGKGFRFLPLSAQEFRELAPVLGALECLGLELSPLDELRAIGQRLRPLSAAFADRRDSPDRVISQDDEWHAVMLSACPNSRLLAVIDAVRASFHRYEALLVPDEVDVDRVVAEHTAIADLLAEGDVSGATVALRQNWMNGMSRILGHSSGNYLDG